MGIAVAGSIHRIMHPRNATHGVQISPAIAGTNDGRLSRERERDGARMQIKRSRRFFPPSPRPPRPRVTTRGISISGVARVAACSVGLRVTFPRRGNGAPRSSPSVPSNGHRARIEQVLRRGPRRSSRSLEINLSLIYCSDGSFTAGASSVGAFNLSARAHVGNSNL